MAQNKAEIEWRCIELDRMMRVLGEIQKMKDFIIFCNAGKFPDEN